MRKYQKETIAGIFVLIGLICTLYMSLKIGNISIFTDNSYSVYAHFQSVSGLKAGNRVELRGIQIGSVSGYFVDQEKQLAVVELKIHEGIKHAYPVIAQKMFKTVVNMDILSPIGI